MSPDKERFWALIRSVLLLERPRMDLEKDIAALADRVSPASIKAAYLHIRNYCRMVCPLCADFCNRRCAGGQIRALLQRKLKELDNTVIPNCQEIRGSGKLPSP